MATAMNIANPTAERPGPAEAKEVAAPLSGARGHAASDRGEWSLTGSMVCRAIRYIDLVERDLS